MDDPIDEALGWGTLILILGIVAGLVWTVTADRPPSRPMTPKHMGSHK